jgi:hypothetical protein
LQANGVQEGYPDKMSVSEWRRGIPRIWSYLRMADNSQEKGPKSVVLENLTWVASVQEKGEQSRYRRTAMV